MRVTGICLALLLLPSTVHAITTSVPATWNIYLSGMPDGTVSLFGDEAPTNSPSPVAGISLAVGGSLSFDASGTTSNGPALPFSGPEGDSTNILDHDFGPENGISDVVAPIRSLIGVFLSASAPNLTPAPAQLDFSTQLSRDYTSLSPALKQVFFIGDGLTSSLERQTISVPSGTTRLFLGTMDTSQWFNNEGSLSVTVVPEPTGLTLALLAVVLSSARRLTIRRS